ncbi:MAG: phosphoadenosine phosphosulfate reductase domain-containing protein [Thermincolia bacterium]
MRWCKNCNREAYTEICDLCGNPMQEDIPAEVYWCSECKVPIIKNVNAIDKKKCPLCKNETHYLCVDLRPVFPEERLLFEVLTVKPMEFISNSVWAADSRYYVDGKSKTMSNSHLAKQNPVKIKEVLNKYQKKNSYDFFEQYIYKFIKANQERLNFLVNEASTFIQSTANKVQLENIVISFSGGKDSTVVADLVVRALSNPSIVHVFGDTTLEFPLTIEYAHRFRRENPKVIFRVAKNKEQDFYKVCEDIGPPARVMRWCCSMFKTGPISRVLNSMFKDNNILTFYGIRKCESVNRGKYNRIEGDSEFIKIRKQTVASPIFYWKDIDIWLYILAQKIDFNDAYRLGYDRVGCWCCPNNNERAQFLSKIYMNDEAKKWREFLIRFATSIGKPDAEVYVDTGKWKARQGGYGVKAAEDIKIVFNNCTTEDNSKIYQINKNISEGFNNLFTPFGIVSNELGRKLINEIVVLDIKNNIPIISIQPFNQEGFEYSVKIKTMNVKNHDELQRMVSYQIRKYNACRKCLKCESLCKYGAITIIGDSYQINKDKCRHCMICVTAKYLEGGCLMNKYLFASENRGRGEIGL